MGKLLIPHYLQSQCCVKCFLRSSFHGLVMCQSLLDLQTWRRVTVGYGVDLKSKVFISKLRTIPELKQCIEMRLLLFLRWWSGMWLRICREACVDMDGNHLSDITFHKWNLHSSCNFNIIFVFRRLRYTLSMGNLFLKTVTFFWRTLYICVDVLRSDDTL